MNSFLTTPEIDQLLSAQAREQAEARIPKHLLYTAGWPTVMPARAEAQLLGEVRLTVARAVGLEIQYIDPDAILARYAQLMEQGGTAVEQQRMFV